MTHNSAESSQVAVHLPLRTHDEIAHMHALQHDDIAALFETFVSLDPQATVTRRIVAEEILSALDEHLRLEGRLLSPRARRAPAVSSVMSERLAREQNGLMRTMVRRVGRDSREGRSVDGKILMLNTLFREGRSARRWGSAHQISGGIS